MLKTSCKLSTCSRAPNIASLKAAQSGFSLIELLISLLIFSVGILGLASMQITSMRMVLDAQQYFSASLLASAISNQLQASGSTQGAEFWTQQVSESLPSGLALIESSASNYRVTLSWNSSEDHARQQGNRRSQLVSSVSL